jgi:hypothetical protein
MIKSDRFAMSLIGLGLFLLVGSFLWPVLLPKKVIWNEEQALEKSDAAADLHRMTHVYAHAKAEDDVEEADRLEKELNKAQTRFDDSKSALNRAQRMRDITPQVLRWCGVALAIVGVVRYKILQSDDRHRKPIRR